MAPKFTVHVTDVSISIKLWRLVAFYCLEPHCAGWWIYRPEHPGNPKVRMAWFDPKRWPKSKDGEHASN